MAKKLFIGGLAWSIDDQQLKEVFSECGAVSSAQVVTDKMTGRSRGFGFVEYEKDEDAENAIKKLNGSMISDRKIIVNEAKPREENSFGGGSRNFSDRGGSRGGGNRGFNSRRY